MTARPSPEVRLSVELLAELDADLLTEPRASQVRVAAAADPAATAALASLSATRIELAGLPVPPLPDGAIDRWTAALRAEAAGGGLRPGVSRPDVVTDTERPSRRRRAVPGRRCSDPARRSRARPVLAAAVLVVAALLGPVTEPSRSGSAQSESTGSEPTGSESARLDRIELATAGRSALGDTDLGPLTDPARRAACLRAVGVLGVDPLAVPIGGRRVELARGPGILLVFVTGELGVFDVVVVDPDCGRTGGTLLGTVRIGR